MSRGELNVVAKVIFTEPAEYDLLDIEHYIHVNLCNPQAAERITNGIVSKARGLETFPAEHSLVNDELLQSVGLRMTRFDNYNIFYYYDDITDIVHIIRILYNRQEWTEILRG